MTEQERTDRMRVLLDSAIAHRNGLISNEHLATILSYEPNATHTASRALTGPEIATAFLAELDKRKRSVGGVNTTRADALERM